MNLQLWITAAVVLAVIFALYKRQEPRMVLLLAGFLLCAVAGSPLAAFKAFVKGMTNPTLVPGICTAMGFAAVVSATKCDAHLVRLLAAPVKRCGVMLLPIATVLTACINIAVMSAAATAATAGATFIPLLMRAGIRPAAAAASIGAGTILGLMLNPGCPHSIFVSKLAGMPLIDFIGFCAPYVVGFVLLLSLVTSACAAFVFKDLHATAEELAAAGVKPEDESFCVNPLKAVAPFIPLLILLVSAFCFPKSGVDIVVAMLAGCAAICLISLKHPGEVTKGFFKGAGAGFVQIVGLIVAATVFTAGLNATGAIGAFIEMLKHSNEYARWSAAFGPFLMALFTGSGEAATWAFNQAVTPHAAEFGMQIHSLGFLTVLAGQFGRTASPLAGALIIVAGMAGTDPFQVAKRLFPAMFVALLVAALTVV